MTVCVGSYVRFTLSVITDDDNYSIMSPDEDYLVEEVMDSHLSCYTDKTDDKYDHHRTDLLLKNFYVRLVLVMVYINYCMAKMIVNIII